ncbi:MAG: hypothetical protein RLZZ241_1290 [Bacteroidota bacterium]|jgi:hypothetical protein
MSLDKILSIGGKAGLYRLVAQTRSGFVAESLIDGKKLSMNLQRNVSVLSEISIYTLEKELPLRAVFAKIYAKENGQKSELSHKAEKSELEAYFFEVLPNYDEDRVYASDIRKVIQWYNILVDHNLVDFSDPEDSEAQGLASDTEE